MLPIFRKIVKRLLYNEMYSFYLDKPYIFKTIRLKANDTHGIYQTTNCG